MQLHDLRAGIRRDAADGEGRGVPAPVGCAVGAGEGAKIRVAQCRGPSGDRRDPAGDEEGSAGVLQESVICATLAPMGATLRTSTIRRRRKTQEKRRKLRDRLAHASSAERAALEARLSKTYQLLTAVPPPAPPAPAAKPRGGRSTGS